MLAENRPVLVESRKVPVENKTVLAESKPVLAVNMKEEVSTQAANNSVLNNLRHNFHKNCYNSE